MTDAERTVIMEEFLKTLLHQTRECSPVFTIPVQRQQISELAYLIGKLKNPSLKPVKTAYERYLAFRAALSEQEDFCLLCGEIYPIWMRSTHMFTCWKLEVK